MSNSKPTFVLIHGSWHGAWAWAEMTPLLAEAGYASLAIDLPGSGSRTRFPASYMTQPVDIEAFTTEPSPIAGITQAERTAATVAAIEAAAKLGNGKVILVGHSWGGLTISHAAEAVSDKIQSLVYLTAFLVPSGENAMGAIAHDSFSQSKALPLYIGDPTVHGGVRINPRSNDSNYNAIAKAGFYHDVSDEHFAAISNLLHCDDIASTSVEPMVITPEKFGGVDRNYIRCTDDGAIPINSQDHMIEQFDASGIGGTTAIYSLPGSHSPFFAQPEKLRDVFVEIAG